MKIIFWNKLNDKQKTKLLKRPAIIKKKDIKLVIQKILKDVKKYGDKSIKKYTKKFDKINLEHIEIVKKTEKLDEKICRAIDTAYRNIRSFHEQQGYQEYLIETMSGVKCQRIVLPLDSVGLYVPGGTAPLISTTLMLAIPAQIAKCPNIYICTPCDKTGNINPYIIYAASLCKVNRIFKIGGAQAIAAMAYGTETVPKCDKIFGPGNAYVTEAKIQVSQKMMNTEIDLPAGPSEICIVANETSDPEFVAADILSQAEHDLNSQVILISTSKKIIIEIKREIDKKLNKLPRKKIIQTVLRNSLAFVSQNLFEAIEIANKYAPEHLTLCVENAKDYKKHLQNAGSIFLGQWSPEAVGDYASGTNHVLPTYGYAKNFSGLNVEAFQKTMSIQTISKRGLKTIANTVETLAKLEQLDAHALSVSVRNRKI
tara:strand:- start:481 stop:1761 length:1281 start_codon:yes stop_codon:yes gene_type:complete